MHKSALEALLSKIRVGRRNFKVFSFFSSRVQHWQTKLQRARLDLKLNNEIQRWKSIFTLDIICFTNGTEHLDFGH